MNTEPNAHPPRPQWERVAGLYLTRAAVRAAKQQPEWAQHTQGITRGALAEQGLSVDDEWTIYAMFRAYWFAHEAMQKRFMDGIMAAPAFAGAQDVLIGFVIGLLPYIPEGARTHG